MSNDKFSWQPLPSTVDWDRLVERSPQGTIFSKKAYLDSANAAYEIFLIGQGNHIKAGVCVTVSEDRKACRLDDLVIHAGILFFPDETKKKVRQRFEQFELTEYAVAELSRRYGSMEIALSPQLDDLRPFLWHNYHDSDEANKFAADLRYTTYVDVSSLVGSEEETRTPLFQAMETLRQRHVREAGKQGAVVRKAQDACALTAYYRELMVRQGVEAEEQKLSRIDSLVRNLLARGAGAVYEVLNAEGVVVYVVFYGWDGKRAYYLFGAGHPEVSEPWQGTFAHWSAFKDLAENLKVREIDLEGVNSPQRGWFKLGFGGELVPYFHVRKRGG